VLEVLKPFTSARQFAAAVFSWGLPLAVALGVYVAFTFPSVQQTSAARAEAKTLQQAGVEPWWILVGLLIVLTAGLSASSRWIFQVLEGIRWPSALRKHREAIHLLQWSVLTAQRRMAEAQVRLEYAKQQLADDQERFESASDNRERISATNAIAVSKIEDDAAEQQFKDAERALADARTARRARPHGWLRRDRPPLFVLTTVTAYPARAEWIRATRLGNRIRAFETDGVHRYGLDPLALWYELLVTAPGGLAENIQAARQGVELWVGTWSAAVLLTVASLATEIFASIARSGHGLITPIVVAVVGSLAASAAYRGATAATEEWRYAVNALVNLGRWPLARGYGLNIPPSLEEEKLMWEALRGYIMYGTEAYANRLDEYRAEPSSGASQSKG
jgi:hypothetical protein